MTEVVHALAAILARVELFAAEIDFLFAVLACGLMINDSNEKTIWLYRRRDKSVSKQFKI